MGVLGPVLAADGGRAPWDDYWYQPRSSAAGLPVSAEEAMTIPAFYAAVSYVAEDVAKLPLSMYEDLGPEGRAPARDHELQERLHNQPNTYQTSLEWREMVTAIAMLRGRCINEVRRDGQIVPLHPDLLRRDHTKAGTRRWWYRDPLRGFAERAILEDEAFIIRGRHDRSVLDFASTNLRTFLDAQALGSFLFRRGAKHQGVIQAKGKLSDPTKAALRTALDEYSIDGPRAGRPLLLEDGMEWKTISMTPADAQLLESRQISVADACRWIRIPPHKVFDLSRSTNNNIESQGTDYVTDAILGWALRWEQSIWRDLVKDKTFFAKHAIDVLLRGDTEARFKAYALAVMWGWMTRNEVREKEDLNPLEGLSEPLTPQNMMIGADGETRFDLTSGSQAQEPLLLEDGDIGEHRTMGLLKLYASDTASRVVRREVAAMSKLAERTAGDEAAWRAGVEAFYAEQGDHLARDLHIPEHEARRHAREQADALRDQGKAAMDDWLTDRVASLATMALDGKRDDMRQAPISGVTGANPAVLRLEVGAPPVVNVAPADVVVNVEPTPVVVDSAPFAAALAELKGAMSTRPTTKTVHRDAAGRIVSITEESA